MRHGVLALVPCPSTWSFENKQQCPADVAWVVGNYKAEEWNLHILTKNPQAFGPLAAPLALGDDGDGDITVTSDGTQQIRNALALTDVTVLQIAGELVCDVSPRTAQLRNHSLKKFGFNPDADVDCDVEKKAFRDTKVHETHTQC